MAIYRCYQFRASSVLLKAEDFDNEAAARRAGAVALFWSDDCDRVEIWRDNQRIVEWSQGEQEVSNALQICAQNTVG